MQNMFSSRLRPVDTVVAGNWKDPKFLQGKVYNIVLADYLLGSIDAFAPYFQDRLFERLKPHVGELLYIVGAEPFPDKDEESEHGQLVIDIAKARDACILLAGDRPYREYPLDWVIRNLKKNGYKVLTISDNIKSRVEYLDKKYSFRKLFDGEVYSYDVGLDKLNKKILRDYD